MGGTCLTSALMFRTLPGKHLEQIAAQMRTHSLNALLIIGGFEVRPWPWAPAGEAACSGSTAHLTI